MSAEAAGTTRLAPLTDRELLAALELLYEEARDEGRIHQITAMGEQRLMLSEPCIEMVTRAIRRAKDAIDLPKTPDVRREASPSPTPSIPFSDRSENPFTRAAQECDRALLPEPVQALLRELFAMRDTHATYEREMAEAIEKALAEREAPNRV